MSNLKTWPVFIAKVGHNWFSSESCTEHFVTPLGQGLGLTIADSELSLADGQSRFCSKCFLGSNEELTHGAENLIGYLDDKTFLEEAGEIKEARNAFNIA